MSTFLSFLTLTAGLVFSLFVFWELLKEDYEDANIFSLGLVSFFAGVFGFFITGLVFPNERLLGALLVLALFGFFGSRRLEMQAIEVFEAAVPAIFAFLLFFLLTVSAGHSLWQIGAETLLIILTLLLFLILRKNYRRFLWYPSGKVGFASLFCFAFYFFTRAGLEMVFTDVLFLISGTMSIWLGPLNIITLAILYIRSDRSIKNDLLWIGKIFKP